MTNTGTRARPRRPSARVVHEEKVVVVGPGVVGMALAALLARQPALVRRSSQESADNDAREARRRRVVVLQRRSPTSGWKIDAINEGRSSIGGIEPQLDAITAQAVHAGSLRATDDYSEASDAELIVVCVQTDRKGGAPDYEPLLAALHPLAEALQERPEGHVPLIVIESTLAPSTMSTVIRDHFASYGLVDGRDILLGASPNRVMPGRLVERVMHADKLIGGLRAETTLRIASYYDDVVAYGALHATNCLTAEVVKTLENAYRDVRIAYAAEVAEYCDAHDVDFFALRDAVNARLAQEDESSFDPLKVANGGLLVPLLGVGGHCLPKDGVLLWWRALEHGVDASRSLLLEARYLNSCAPIRALDRIEREFGSVAGKDVALLGVAYRPDSDDTRNSPTLALADALRRKGASVRLHDPWVRASDPNVARMGFSDVLTKRRDEAMRGADLVVIGICHGEYRDDESLLAYAGAPGSVLFDAANALRPDETVRTRGSYAGIGRGTQAPDESLVADVVAGFRAVEVGVANETMRLTELLNEKYAATDHERVDFSEVRRLAGTCTTGCRIVNPGSVVAPTGESGFDSVLVRRALGTAGKTRWTP
jgi:UDP-N-acetyl-D-mannosaminuronic acid dehydrogenase